MAWVAMGIELSDAERGALAEIVRSPTSEQRMVTRARVVLVAAEGKPNRQIAEEVGLSEQKVGQWRRRFAERRLKGLSDLPRPGAPRRYDHDKRVEVFKTACSPPPEGETHKTACSPPPEGETHWTVRSLAQTVGISKSQTHAILSEADLKPHQGAPGLPRSTPTSTSSRPRSAAST